MRLSALLAVLLPAVSVLADEPLKPFSHLSFLDDRSPADLSRRQQCSSNGYATCGDSCMPSDATCCDSSGSYCDAGDRCVTGGCCPIGKRCSGGGGGTIPVSLSYSATGSGSSPTTRAGSGSGSGSSSSPTITRRPTVTTTTTTSSVSCPAGRQACKGQCISAVFTCCPDDVRYCSANEQCVLTGTTEYGCSTLASASKGAGAVEGAANSPNGGGGVLTVAAGQVWAAGAVLAGAAML